MSLRRHAALVAFAVLSGAALSGCGAYTVNLRHEPLLETTRFTWSDERPEDLRDSSIGSLAITSCDYGIRRMGDDKFTPDRVAVLRSDLERGAGAELAGHRVVLKAYTVHLNQATSIRRDVGYSATGIVANALNDKSKVGCAVDDLAGGYDAREKRTEYDPLIVVVDLELDGKPVHTRWFENAPKRLSTMTAKDPDWNAWANRAIRQATKKVIVNVKAALARPPAVS